MPTCITNFYFLAGGIAVAGSFQVLLRFYAKFTIQTIAANVRKESRINAIDKIISLDLDWHEKEESGSKIQKINNGGQKLYDGIADFSNDGISIATALIGSLIISALVAVVTVLIGELMKYLAEYY